MLDHIKSIIRSRGGATKDPEESFDEVQLAVAALLVEAACTDRALEDDERAVIERHLADRFALDAGAAGRLLAKAEKAVSQSAELYGFTRTIKDSCPREERLELMQVMWEVAYTDGELHDYEANLMRRVAGLLYITDRESGTARKQALAQRNLSE